MPTAEESIAQVRHLFWRTRVLVGRELRPWAAGAAALWGLGLAVRHGLWPEARLLFSSLCQGLWLARMAEALAEGALRAPRLALRPEAEHLLASVLHGRRSYADAAPHYESALACPDHPRRDMSMVGLGLALGAAGDHEQALRWFREARQVAPPQQEAFVAHLTGWALCRLGRLDEAECALRCALQRVNVRRRGSVLFWLGVVLGE